MDTITLLEAYAKTAQEYFSDEKYDEKKHLRLVRLYTALEKRLQELETKAGERDKCEQGKIDMDLVFRVMRGDKDALEEWKEKK
jgi:hypothetical protein